METLQLLGLALGTAFSAGLNVYATVAVLGAAEYFDLFNLPAGLSILSHPIVIFGAAMLFFLEFFADKIPYVDTLWHGVHTFIRPVAAGALSLGIFSDMPDAWKVIAALVGGSVALTSHGAKATTRIAANTSPEPFSNAILSVVEDAIAISLTALAMKYPVIAGGVVLVLLVVAFFIIRGVVRFFRRAIGSSSSPPVPVSPSVSAQPPPP
jgi:hypothetical protein